MTFTPLRVHSVSTEWAIDFGVDFVSLVSIGASNRIRRFRVARFHRRSKWRLQSPGMIWQLRICVSAIEKWLSQPKTFLQWRGEAPTRRMLEWLPHRSFTPKPYHRHCAEFSPSAADTSPRYDVNRQRGSLLTFVTIIKERRRNMTLHDIAIGGSTDWTAAFQLIPMILAA